MSKKDERRVETVKLGATQQVTLADDLVMYNYKKQYVKRAHIDKERSSASVVRLRVPAVDGGGGLIRILFTNQQAVSAFGKDKGLEALSDVNGPFYLLHKHLELSQLVYEHVTKKQRAARTGDETETDTESSSSSSSSEDEEEDAKSHKRAQLPALIKTPPPPPTIFTAAEWPLIKYVSRTPGFDARKADQLASKLNLRSLSLQRVWNLLVRDLEQRGLPGDGPPYGGQWLIEKLDTADPEWERALKRKHRPYLPIPWKLLLLQRREYIAAHYPDKKIRRYLKSADAARHAVLIRKLVLPSWDFGQGASADRYWREEDARVYDWWPVLIQLEKLTLRKLKWLRAQLMPPAPIRSGFQKFAEYIKYVDDDVYDEAYVEKQFRRMQGSSSAAEWKTLLNQLSDYPKQRLHVYGRFLLLVRLLEEDNPWAARKAKEVSRSFTTEADRAEAAEIAAALQKRRMRRRRRKLS